MHKPLFAFCILLSAARMSVKKFFFQILVFIAVLRIIDEIIAKKNMLRPKFRI